MYERRFSRWASWGQRAELNGLTLPGVYVVARAQEALGGQHFSWRPEIFYVGMTNSTGGLAARLRQFDRTLNGKLAHGGADRVRLKHPNYKTLVPHLYVAVAPFDCDVKTFSPADLRIMGDVAKFEFDCLAAYVKRHGLLPRFNNKASSPKYSKLKKPPNSSGR
jgi:hypothetical protein